MYNIPIMLNIVEYFMRRKKNPPLTLGKLINERISFPTWNGDAYSNATYRSAVDAVARNIAKLRGVHTIRGAPCEKTRLNHILQVRPNDYMSAYDFLYKLASQLWVNGNAWACIDFAENGDVKAIYPITATSVQMLTDERGKLYAEFVFRNGQTAIFRYSELIHLRRFFNSNELLGEGSGALDAVLELADAENATITQGIKAGANIRGILKYTGMLQDTDLKEIKDKFVADYLSMNNSGGIAAIDTKVEYTPINNNPVILDAEQSKTIREKIFGFVGISEKIVNSSYSEDDFAAFYESTIEPFAIALSLECTAKILTEREISFGHEIIFDANRLQFVSNATKVNLIKELMPFGILTINQALEILNLPRVTDGDIRYQSLNYVQQSEALKYQLARAHIKDE